MKIGSLDILLGILSTRLAVAVVITTSAVEAVATTLNITDPTHEMGEDLVDIWINVRESTECTARVIRKTVSIAEDTRMLANTVALVEVNEIDMSTVHKLKRLTTKRRGMTRTHVLALLDGLRNLAGRGSDSLTQLLPGRKLVVLVNVKVAVESSNHGLVKLLTGMEMLLAIDAPAKVLAHQAKLLQVGVMRIVSKLWELSVEGVDRIRRVDSSASRIVTGVMEVISDGINVIEVPIRTSRASVLTGRNVHNLSRRFQHLGVLEKL